MTTINIQDQIEELFVDARQLHNQALYQLEHGDIRDAAEKAWGATSIGSNQHSKVLGVGG